MPGDELPKTPPKSPDKQKPDDIAHITHKAKKLEVKELVSMYSYVHVNLCLVTILFLLMFYAINNIN